MCQRITTILHVISGLKRGGAETVLERIVRLDKQNDHIVVSLTGKGDLYDTLVHNGVEVYCLNIDMKIPRVSSLVKLFRLMRREDVSCIQTWMYHADFIGGVLGRIAKKRVVWNIRHSNFSFKEDKLRTLLLMYVNSVLSYFIPDKIVCCADGAKRVHSKLGYSRRKMEVITNSVETEILKPSRQNRITFRNIHGISEDSFTIALVARFSAQKDFNNFLGAVQIFKKIKPNFICIIAGEGADFSNPEFAELCAKYHLTKNIVALGKLSDTLHLMQSVDLLVLSSSHGEGYPNVLIEALSCGVPVVSTDVGDARKIVEDCGWIVPIRNSKELAQAIASAYNMSHDVTTWHAFSLRARNLVVERNDIFKMIESYSLIWSGE